MKQALITILGLLAANMIVSSNAQAATAQCHVLVSATIAGKPALQPVQIAIYNDHNLVTSTTQHTFNVDLDCSKHYTAKLSLGKIERSRTFTTVSGGSEVIVAMD